MKLVPFNKLFRQPPDHALNLLGRNTLRDDHLTLSVG